MRTPRPLSTGVNVDISLVEPSTVNGSRNGASINHPQPRREVAVPPNSTAVDVFATISTLTGQLHILQQQRTAELAANSGRALSTAAATAGDCAICLEVLTSPESVITQCGHVYHFDCLMRCPGFRYSSIPCPACRRQICKPELVTIRNGLPQKDSLPDSNMTSIGEPSKLVPLRTIDVDGTSHSVNENRAIVQNSVSRTNAAENNQLVMNLLSDSDNDDEPLVSTTRRRSSLGSDVIEVPCTVQDTFSNRTCSRVRSQHRDRHNTLAIDDKLRRLIGLLTDSLRAGVESYEKAKRDLQTELFKKSRAFEQEYELLLGKLETRSVLIDSREKKISALELQVRKKLEEVDSLERQHSEAIAENNEEKGRLSSRSKLIDQEKIQIDAVRAKLTDREHELRVKESRVSKMMKLYNERLSALDIKADDDVNSSDPKVSTKAIGKRPKRKARNTSNSADEEDSEDSVDDCIVDAVDRAVRAGKLRDSKRIASRPPDDGPTIDPTLALGEQLYSPAPTSRPVPSRSLRAKKTGIGRKNAGLSSFLNSRPVVQRPSGAIGKPTTARR